LATANEKLLRVSLRHQVDVRRFAAGEVRAILRLLEGADRELVEKLRVRLARLGAVTDFTSRRYRAVLEEIRELRRTVVDAVRRRTAGKLEALAAQEIRAEGRAIKASIPIRVELARLPIQSAAAIATERPFQGKLLGEWFSELRATDQRNLVQEIQLGLAQGEGVQQIVRRVAGTRANGFQDGVLAITRRNAEAVVRTAVNHVSNAAREAVWEGNEDIVSALRWTATLDGRTSAICRSRDGALVMLDDRPLPEGERALEPNGARPSAHVNCLLGDSYVLPCGGITAAMKRFYAGEIVVIRTASKHELTCTPNHPILTDRGWVAAKLLDRSDRVICYLGSKDPFSGVEHEHQDGPSRIENVARPLLEGPGMNLVSTSGCDFHGDAIDGEVCIIGTKSLLKRVEAEPALQHHIVKQSLESRGSRVHLSLPGSGTKAFLLERPRSSSRRNMGGRNLGRPILRCSSIPDSLISLTASSSLLGISPCQATSLSGTSSRYSSFLENSIEDDVREFAISADVMDSLSGHVSCDEIVDIERRDFSGHVFNLQTGSGIYFATFGNIITHNCRSVMVSVIDGEALVGNRPFVSDARRPDERLADFRAEARRTGRPIGEIREEWADENIGSVPAKITYGEWLGDQSAAFQDEVLGPTRGALFRRGGLEIHEFTDRRGNELTLEELEARHGDAFEEANLGD